MTRKRSITVARHRTSVTVEDSFWTALINIAAFEKRTIAALVEHIDQTRAPKTSLSSGIRLYVLNWFQRKMKEPSEWNKYGKSGRESL